MSARLRRGATKIWQENREEGVSLKERVNEKTRESQPKTQTKKSNKRLRGEDFQKENLRYPMKAQSAKRKTKKLIKEASMRWHQPG